jgi:ribosomal-protein-alanine N-acetyltransferase
MSTGDAEPIVEVLRANRDFLAPWEPARTDDYFTLEHQRREIVQLVEQYAEGTALPFVILSDDELVGRIVVSNIVRRAFHSGDLGYWVSQSWNGRGVATAAVAAMVTIAFADARLHRLQASTLQHNVGSQRVLQRNGFESIGAARQYLRIDGRWQDHLLFQRINEAF